MNWLWKIMFGNSWDYIQRWRLRKQHISEMEQGRRDKYFSNATVIGDCDVPITFTVHSDSKDRIVPNGRGGFDIIGGGGGSGCGTCGGTGGSDYIGSTAGASGSSDTLQSLRAERDEANRRSKELLSVLAFYANPETYYAIGFIPDRPCGEFETDFDSEYEHEDMQGPRPGARGRKAIKGLVGDKFSTCPLCGYDGHPLCNGHGDEHGIWGV
jgi:hypothetical protein